MHPGHLLQTSLNAAIPWAPGETAWHTKQHLIWFLGSFTEGFCVWQLFRAMEICGCHHFVHPTWWGTSAAVEQPPVESRSCFYCLSSYTIYSSILLLCINFLNCPSCHICTVTSWFPIFNCPQRASSRATPAFVGTLICHCPNWSCKHLKFSLYEHVVFLQVCD